MLIDVLREESDEETIDSFKDDDAILLLDNELIDVENIESLEDIFSLLSSLDEVLIDEETID